MNPSVGPDLTPQQAQHVGDVLEFSAKAAVSAGILWAFFVKIAKPFVEWRSHRRAAEMRAALKTELDCMSRMPALEEAVAAVLDRQTAMFDEMDLFLKIATENHERLDEFRELMDEIGFASRDRRDVADRRLAVSDALRELYERRTARRRRDDVLDDLKRQGGGDATH